MPTILGTYTPGSPEWHALRWDRIGGSEIGAVCGWSKYISSDDLMAHKLAREDTPQSKAMRRGHLCEPAVLAHLTDRYDLAIDRQASEATYAADDDQRFLYNPDALTASGLLLEAKTTSDRSDEDGWGRAGTDKCPIGYQAQAQWGMGILNFKECRLGVLAGAHNGRPDLHFADYRIRFNPKIFDYMRRQAVRFLDELAARKAKQ